MISEEPLNVRACLGSEFLSYGKMPAGIPLQVMQSSNDGRWVAVAIPTAIAPDEIGWVRAGYLQPAK